LRRAQDDPLGLGIAISRLASVAWRRGDFDAAVAHHRQALPLFEQAGADALFLTELQWLGETSRDRGDLDDGERLLEETARRARALGFDQQLTSTLHSLGDVSLDRADPDTALQRYAAAMEYAVATGSRRVQIYCVAGIACALMLRGDGGAAARLWEIAEDQERRLGFRMLQSERQRYERLMSGRPGVASEAEPRAGAELTLEQAVAEARLHVPV
jgi:tetratricopeptide (TPR) repeat protein